MGEAVAVVERLVAAPADAVFEYLRDYHPRVGILPKQFSDYRVIEGGVGAGTLISFRFKVGRSDRVHRLRVEESLDEHRLVERDLDSSYQMVWVISTGTDPDSCHVAFSSRSTRAKGIDGLLEGLYGTIGLRPIYAELLANLNAAVAG